MPRPRRAASSSSASSAPGPSASSARGSSASSASSSASSSGAHGAHAPRPPRVAFDAPAVRGVLLRRYKRFFVDARLDDGRQVVAHCTNTGRMTGCCEPGSPVLLTPAPTGPGAPKRKLQWTLRAVRAGRSWVSVDTLMANRVVAEALRRGALPGLDGYDEVATEVTLDADGAGAVRSRAGGAAPGGGGSARGGRAGRTRIDVVLRDGRGRRPDCYVEIKNVTLREGRRALFPDAVSARGLKHLEELAALARAGHRAVLLPFVARTDCTGFDAAAEVDPDWAAGLHAAAAAGVEVHPWRAGTDARGVRLLDPLPWISAPSGPKGTRNRPPASV